MPLSAFAICENDFYEKPTEAIRDYSSPNGVRYPQVGGRGLCLEAKKTRSRKNAPKTRRLPLVGRTLCWAAYGSTN